MLRQGIPVTAFGGHGIIGIGDGDDSGVFGDILALEAVRVTLPVVPFMMIVGTDAQVGRLLYAGENLIAVNRMHFDLGKFLGGQLAFLVEDIILDADLAHVMEQGGKIDFFAFLVVLAGSTRNLQGILCHTGGVTAGIFILGVDGIGKCLRRLFKHRVFLFLCFPVEVDFLHAGVFDLFCHVLQGEDIKQGGHGNNGEIIQRDAVEKELQDGGDDTGD